MLQPRVGHGRICLTLCQKIIHSRCSFSEDLTELGWGCLHWLLIALMEKFRWRFLKILFWYFKKPPNNSPAVFQTHEKLGGTLSNNRRIISSHWHGSWLDNKWPNNIVVAISVWINLYSAWGHSHARNMWNSGPFCSHPFPPPSYIISFTFNPFAITSLLWTLDEVNCVLTEHKQKKVHFYVYYT